MKTENVWDYPRPAICEPFAGSIRVIHAGIVLAETTRAFRVLETSHPPTYYLPPQSITLGRLQRNGRVSGCEWKGQASYFDLDEISNVAWCYDSPTKAFVPMTGFLSFYASKVDECWVNKERIQPQEGDFYGGWITSNLTGPFKGGPGTMGW